MILLGQEIYEQVDGLAMGAQKSSIIPETFLQNFGIKIINIIQKHDKMATTSHM